MGRIIAITSGKGGAGKTTFAVNIGTILAKRGLKTILVDMNIGTRNLDIYLGLENKVLFDLGDIFTGACDLEKAIIQDEKTEDLYLLSCPQYKIIRKISEGHVKVLCEELLKTFDYVIMDCPAGLSEVTATAAAAANTALIVTTPDYVSIRNSDSVNRKLEFLGIENRFLAVNMIDLSLTARGLLPGISEITRDNTAALCGMISYDSGINISNNSGCPSVLSGSEYLVKAFSEMAEVLAK